MNDATKREILKFVSAANPGDTRLVEIDGVAYRIEAVGRQSTADDDESKRCENCGLRGTLADNADKCPNLNSCLADDAYGAGLDFNVWRFYEKPSQNLTKGQSEMEDKKKNDLKRFDTLGETPERLREIAAIASAAYRRGYDEAKLQATTALGLFNLSLEGAPDEAKRIADNVVDAARSGLLQMFAKMEPSKSMGVAIGTFADDEDEDAENDSAADAENEERAENEKLVAAFGGPVVEGTDADVVAGSETPVRGCDPGQPGYYELTPENCIGEIGVIGPTGPETNGANENEL